MPRIKTADVTRDFIAMTIDAVCVDTSTYEKLDFAFNTNVLEQVKSIKDSRIKLLMIDIVEREVLAHLAGKVQENVVALRRAMRSAKNYGLAKPEDTDAFLFQDIEHEAHAREHLSQFIEGAGIEVISAADYCSSQQILDNYFEMRPPFGRKKKSEFPDAFSLGALEGWSANHNRRVLIFSDDKDWISFAETSERIFCGPSLTDFLAALPDMDEVVLLRAARSIAGEKFTEVAQAIGREVAGLPIDATAEGDHYVEAMVLDSGLLRIQPPSPNGADFEVIGHYVDDLSVRWYAEATIWYEASARFSVRDIYDRDFVPLPAIRLRGERTVPLEVLLSFDMWEEKGVLGIDFNQASVVNDTLHFDLGYVDLDLSGD